MKLRCLFLLTVLLAATGLHAAERIPAAPANHFNDYAGVVGRSTAIELDRQLAQFERDSSSQLLVVIYPKMESASSVEDYTVRVAQAWHAGQKGRDNGAVLFAFMQEHQLYIQVGYGLEGAIPDATAKRIIESEIVPRFRQGDVDGGMAAAVSAMIRAAKGEYKGTGTTQAERKQGTAGQTGGTVFVAIFFLVLVFAARHRRRSALPYIIGGSLLRPRNNSWWDDNNSGGGSSWGGGSGGGGFSGGGGSFGGGGAGGKW